MFENHKSFIIGVILGSFIGFMFFRQWQHNELERMYKGKENAQ